MQRSCSWIPRSGFIRFCNGKRAADARSKRSGINKKNAISACYRATVKAPEDAPKIGFPPLAHWAQQRGIHLSGRVLRASVHRRGKSHLRDNMKAYHPMRICTRDRGRHPIRSTLTNVNPQAEPKLSIGGSAILNEDDEFIAEKAKEEGWCNMDKHKSDTRETIAKALYHVYLDTVAATRRAQDPVVGSITQSGNSSCGALNDVLIPFELYAKLCLDFRSIEWLD
ncbi:hypothetical protein N7530_008893 [Penicillium desertorum]|uniref:Uncharacterized protein n=1 Tax=Penicillium desertorum TaxID=1303715 RepID=A0A9W9WQ94_9EURO|nr:hypothetical protein N7530_008893 [Penicillium desertorum]